MFNADADQQSYQQSPLYTFTEVYALVGNQQRTTIASTHIALKLISPGVISPQRSVRRHARERGSTAVWRAAPRSRATAAISAPRPETNASMVALVGNHSHSGKAREVHLLASELRLRSGTSFGLLLNTFQ